MTIQIPAVSTLSTSDQATVRWAQTVNIAFEALRSAGVLTSEDLTAFATKYGIDATASSDKVSDKVSDSAIPDLVTKLLANAQFQSAIATKSTAAASAPQTDTAVHDLEARLLTLIGDLQTVQSTSAYTPAAATNILNEFIRLEKLLTVANPGMISGIAVDASGNAVLDASGKLTYTYVQTPALDKVVTLYNTMYKNVAEETRRLEILAARRGPITASFKGSSAYSDYFAAQLIWTQQNRGYTWAGIYPGMPGDPSTFLIAGDVVTIAWDLDAYGAPNSKVTKQWLGASLGWQFFSYPYVAFEDVLGLPQLFEALGTVVPERGKLRQEAIVSGATLKLGTGVSKTGPTLQDIVHELDYATAGTQAKNVLDTLADYKRRLDELEHQNDYNAPGTQAYNTLVALADHEHRLNAGHL